MPANTSKSRVKENVFHLMLQNNVAPNIGQEVSSNQLPIILVVGLYTTCRGERVLVVLRFNATCLPLRP